MSLRLMKRVAWLFIILLTACQQSDNQDEPPDIVYGQDVCDECGMIINEQRFAASYVTVDGQVRRFDDIGGMLIHDSKMNEEVNIYWVHDLNTEEWIDASQAVFVIDRGLTTPMGWGVAAFENSEDAEAYVAELDGAMASFAELKEQANTGSLDPEDSAHDHEEHEHQMSDD